MEANTKYTILSFSELMRILKAGGKLVIAPGLVHKSNDLVLQTRNSTSKVILI